MHQNTLHFYNTLTNKKEPFTPNTKFINWYTCGPTVYDSPHIGHARTYISFDIIRSILETYFAYSINYVMNITDVDDKIITKANELNVDCDKITKKYENEFFKAMDALEVKMPTFVTRVTEFIAIIEEFIDKLLENEMAYESEDGVYFNIEKYRNLFEYPIFVDKSAVSNLELDLGRIDSIDNITENPCLNQEENNLSHHMDKEKTTNNNNVNSMESIENINKQILKMRVEKPKKRNNADFALWKKRVEGFAYDSKLGRGRPGWHIECSAMACNIFPDGLDIHSGGIDLAFPHHENEVAQSQARIGKPWVKVFLHSGHLHIDGLKMSKSLKNFITIDEFLKEYTARQIRMVFLINKWNMPMTHSKEYMQNAVNIEKKIFTFMSVLESQIDAKSRINNVVFNESDRKMFDYLQNFKNDIHIALCDNIDTAEVIRCMVKFISNVNSKMDEISRGIKVAIFEYFNYILNALGMKREISTINTHDDEVLNILSDFRKNIRVVCKNKGGISDIYKVTDLLRDKLKESGFIIEDKGDDSRIRRI